MLLLSASASIALVCWLYLVLLHGRFWVSGPELAPAQRTGASVVAPLAATAVDVVVPARDEAALIGPVIASLLAQDHAGAVRIFLVDDNSSDGTAAKAGTDARLTIIRGTPKPAGWSGKLWAVQQGVAAGTAPLVLLTDADILHDPRHLGSLVGKLEAERLDLVSEMVALNCESLAERALVPAFVYFFQLLYPFRRVNDPASGVAAAAGGTVLVRRRALERIGGIAAIRGALIDDVALARAIKRGGALYLGHSGLARSIRPYPHVADVWQMIARTAFTQLDYSFILLLGTVAGLLLIWWAPPLAALLGTGAVRAAGIASSLLAAASYVPTLRRYRRSPWWSLTLPLIALFYLAATVGSAIDHWRGQGARWKSRSYG
jgi:hopene-associated glycosyltransferase HpnB